MARGDDEDRDLSKNEKHKMETEKYETMANLEISDRRSSDNCEQAESGESSYETAYSSPYSSAGPGNADEDAEASKRTEAVHLASAVLNKQKPRRSDGRDAPASAASKEELRERWAEQKLIVNDLEAEKEDLEEQLDELRIKNTVLQAELSKLTRPRNGREATNQELQDNLEKDKLENEQLKEQNEARRLKVHELAAEVKNGMDELKEQLRINEVLRGDLERVEVEQRRERNAKQALQVKAQQLVQTEARNKILKAELDKSRDALMKAQEHINLLEGQQQEMTMERHRTSFAEVEGENPLYSLEDEMWDTCSVNSRSRGEDEEHHIHHVAYGTKGRQTLEPAVKFDEEDLSIQRNNSSTGNQEKSEEIKNTTKNAQASDQSVSDTSTKAAKPGYSKSSVPSPDTPARESGLTVPADFLADLVPTMFGDGHGLTQRLGRRVDLFCVWPATPRTHNMQMDSEPPPLSLTERLNGFQSRTRPGQALLLSISEVESSDFDELETELPPPWLDKDTPGLIATRPRGPLGSSFQFLRPRSDTIFANSDIALPVETVRISDLSPSRRRPNLQEWSQLRLEELVRSGPAALSMLDYHIRNIFSQGASAGFGLSTGGQSAQIRMFTGETRTDKARSSVERTVPHALTRRWLLLLCLVCLLWFVESDKQLWMQANETTRQKLLAVRDENWAKPWLAKMDFDVENMLQMDRSLLA